MVLAIILEYWRFGIVVDHQFHVCRQKADVEAALADWRGVVGAIGVPRAER